MVRGYSGRHSRADSDSFELSRGESDEVSTEEEEMTSYVNSAGKEKRSREWTDEKHSMYLKSMEASFVDQLYNTLGNLGSHCNKNNVLDFKVLRSGFCQRTPDVKRSDTRREFLASPWIKHFDSEPKIPSSCPKGKIICSSGPASTPKQTYAGPVCSGNPNQDQIDNREEVSDQNFIDEETKDEKASSPKKMKIEISESSSNDQVVPYGKTSTICNQAREKV